MHNSSRGFCFTVMLIYEQSNPDLGLWEAGGAATVPSLSTSISDYPKTWHHTPDKQNPLLKHYENLKFTWQKNNSLFKTYLLGCPNFWLLETISGICLTYSSLQCKQYKMHI
jgi:hypothetical protein